MFVAMRPNGERLNLLQPLGREQLQQLRASEAFYCPICQGGVQLKLGMQKKPHFAHKRAMSCSLDLEAESAYHLAGKEMLYHWLRAQQIAVEPEVYVPSIRQRPDLLITTGDSQTAIEFQCSSISTQRFLERTQSYWREGIRVLWILGGNQYKRYSSHWTSLPAFSALFSQGKLPFILYFCPNAASFLKCSPLLPFSAATAFSHTFVHQLSTSTISSVFSDSPFTFPTLQAQWLQKKKRWRLGQFLHMQKGYEAFFRFLYERGIAPSLLPSEAGLPTPALLSIQTPALVWQALLLLDVFSPMQIGATIHLSQLLRYVDNQPLIKRRILPYYPLSYFQIAVKEYVAVLCSCQLLEAVGRNMYRKKKPLVLPKTDEEALRRDADMLEHVQILFQGEQATTLAGEKRL